MQTFLPRIWRERKNCVGLCQKAPSGLLSSRGTCRRSAWCPLTPDRRRCSLGWTGRCVQTGACWTRETNVLIRRWTEPKMASVPFAKSPLTQWTVSGQLSHWACFFLWMLFIVIFYHSQHRTYPFLPTRTIQDHVMWYGGCSSCVCLCFL